MQKGFPNERMSSPTGDSFTSIEFDEALLDPGSPLSPVINASSPLALPIPTFKLHNAVHMEVQENAKLPTFNLAVDRSSRHSTSAGYAPATAKAIDDMVRLAKNDCNLAEMFLQSDKRANANLAFSGPSLLLGDRHGGITDFGHDEAPQSPLHQASLATVSGSDIMSTTSSNGDMQSYYPYGRRYPLPIPRKPPSPVNTATAPSTSSVGQQGDPLAVAIAAAIASQQDGSDKKESGKGSSKGLSGSLKLDPNPMKLKTETIDTSSLSRLPSSKTPEDSLPLPQAKATLSIQSTLAGKLDSQANLPQRGNVKVQRSPDAGRSSTCNPSVKTVAAPMMAPHRNRAAAAKTPEVSLTKVQPPKSASPQKAAQPVPLHTQRPTPAAHAAAHAKSSASIKEATKRRAQFGFGGNHVVPSVPLPPKKAVPAKKAKKPKPKRVPVPPSIPLNGEVAYERKKQRAKDARVRLNDSIERLHISFNLVGTQSKQRAEQLRALNFGGEPPTKIDEIRQNAIKILDNCQTAAKEAKKWDRPSFVGTAATMIQELNSECEAMLQLMIECSGRTGVVNEQHEKRKQPCVNQGLQTKQEEITQDAKRQKTFSSGAVVERIQVESSGKVKHSMVPTASLAAGNPSSSFEATSNVDSVMSESKVASVISSYLDPLSLAGCTEVSKLWRTIDAFRHENTWRVLCIKRFGPSKVREWEETEPDVDDGDAISKFKLYGTMEENNVKPHCLHEGNVFLGQVKLPGIASAWASMVARSNGETSRSVRLENSAGIPSHIESYRSLPVVELRLLIQNTGSSTPIVLHEQVVTVDASTRRRGEEMSEIQWDDRFEKRILQLDGAEHGKQKNRSDPGTPAELCRMHLFESVILVAHVYARGCSTTSKFQKRANFAKVLLTVNGTTVPLAIPFDGKG